MKTDEEILGEILEDLEYCPIEKLMVDLKMHSNGPINNVIKFISKEQMEEEKAVKRIIERANKLNW